MMGGGVRSGSGDSGSVLVVVVLLTLALFVLAHGLAISSRSEILVSRAGARHVEARAAADGALVDLLERGGGSWMDSVAVWDRGGRTATETGVITVATAWRRLDAEAWLVEASASRGDDVPVVSAGLVWVFDPVERLRDLSAVVSVGPEAVVSRVGPLRGDSITVVGPPADPDACEQWRRRLEEIYPLGSTLPIGLVEAPRLGRIDFEQLMAATPVAVSGTGTPVPREALGVCAVNEAWNWGDPDRPRRPCGSHLALRRAEGGLDVVGGVGQGVLIVDGDLVLRAGARFHGLVIVAGTLRVIEGARLEGMGVAYTGVEVGADAAIRGSACWAVRALAAHRTTLGRPVPLHGATRIGPY